MGMNVFQQPISERKTGIPVKRIEDTNYLGDTSFQEPISKLETRIPVERIGDTNSIYSVSTNRIRLLWRHG